MTRKQIVKYFALQKEYLTNELEALRSRQYENEIIKIINAYDIAISVFQKSFEATNCTKTQLVQAFDCFTQKLANEKILLTTLTTKEYIDETNKAIDSINIARRAIQRQIRKSKV